MLGVFGVVFIALGYGLAAGPSEPPFPIAMLTNDALGAIWATVGALCVVMAFNHHDRYAFGLATGLCVAWSAGFFTSFLFGLGPALNWIRALTWALVAVMIWTIAGWPEDRR